MIKLSIIVPVYNVEKYIRPCIESIFKQGLDDDDYEVIIVNDGSTDNSMEMIADVIGTHNNVFIINQSNLSLSVARNNGIAKARGEYLLMPDSDDLLIENSLKPLLEKALETKADMVVADYLYMTDEEIDLLKESPIKQDKPTFEEKTGQQMYEDFYLPYRAYVWRILFRKEFVTGSNLKFYPGIAFQDIPFTHESYLKAQKCIKANWYLNIYRKRECSTSFPENFNRKKAQNFCKAMELSWKLKYAKGIAPRLATIINDKVFMSFESLVQKLCYVFNNNSDRVSVIKELMRMCPNLKFTHGFKQRLYTFLFRYFPNIFIRLMLMIKVLIWRKKSEI